MMKTFAIFLFLSLLTGLKSYCQTNSSTLQTKSTVTSLRDSVTMAQYFNYKAKIQALKDSAAVNRDVPPINYVKSNPLIETSPKPQFLNHKNTARLDSAYQ